MSLLSEMQKVLVRVKSVPDAEPNAEGVNVTLLVNPCYLSPKTNFDYLTSLLPRGRHAVKVERM